jgi:hypothetical protein
MNLIRAFVEALNPCIHQWEKIDALYDDKDDPSETKIVRQCSVCGEISDVTIKAPTKRSKDWVCPPHRWAKVRETKVVDDMAKVAKGTASTVGYLVIQQCTACGEMRTIKQGFEHEEDNYKPANGRK